MTLKVSQRLCPKCGEPPRFAVGQFFVHVEATVVDGVLKTGKPKYVGKPANELVELECGGGHRWKIEVTT